MFSTQTHASAAAPSLPPRRLALAAALGLLCAGAGAQVTSMHTYGSYAVDGGATSMPSDSWSPGDGSVRVYHDDGRTGLYSYGDVGGNFASRSIGNGVYQVATFFEVVRSVTNTSSTAQLGYFHFHISPGMLSNEIGSPLGDGHYVEAGMSFELRRDNNQLWSSAATLRSDAGGSSFFSYADASLYAGAGQRYLIAGTERTVELGLLAPGQTIQLSYRYTTFSDGDSVGGPGRHVDAVDFVVPADWHSYGPCPSQGRSAMMAMMPMCELYQPGQLVHIDGYDLPGATSGAWAGSGDPFDVQMGERYFHVDGGPNALDEVILTAVPEPSGGAMLLGGLGLVGALARRRHGRVRD